jgi:hypothetical protein
MRIVLVAGEALADWAKEFVAQAVNAQKITASKALFPLLQFGFTISEQQQFRTCGEIKAYWVSILNSF